MYCFHIGRHSSLDWFLHADMMKKVTFEQKTSWKHWMAIRSADLRVQKDFEIIKIFFMHVVLYLKRSKQAYPPISFELLWNSWNINELEKQLEKVQMKPTIVAVAVLNNMV